MTTANALNGQLTPFPKAVLHYRLLGIFGARWSISAVTQCLFDTLNAPADKLLLSVLKKLGGHSAISGRSEQVAPLLALNVRAVFRP